MTTSGGREPTDCQRYITRGLELLGVAIAVLGSFGLLVVGVESGNPLVGALGLVLAAVTMMLVTVD